MKQNKFAGIVKPLALLGVGVLTLMSASVARAADPTLTIVDDGEPHGKVTHMERFSTQLTASVQDAPETTEEIEITGPTYQWNTSGAGLKLVSITSNPNNLESDAVPNYGGAGDKTATVRCTATFTRKNKKTSEILDPITVSNSKPVKFYVRMPVRVAVIDGRPAFFKLANRSSPWYGDLGWWGSMDLWRLRVRDNQGNAYGYGDPHEDLVPDVPGVTEGTWGGPEDPVVEGTFEDGHGKADSFNPGLPNGTVLANVDQIWHILENGDDRTLNKHHIIDWHYAPNDPNLDYNPSKPHLTSTHEEID